MASYEATKRRVAQILDIPSAPDDVAGRWFDRFIVALIVLNAAVAVAETMGDVQSRHAAALRAFELASLVVFGAEFALRLWSITARPEYASPVAGRLRFLASPFALIDLVAIAPLFFLGTDLRFVRTLRLLRLLKLTRYSDSFRILTNVLRKSREELLMALSIVLLALFLVSGLMYNAEREAQPDAFSSIPDAMYWGVVALTTTGYGDVVPVTPAGKVLAGVTSILGVATIALPVGILASGFVDEIQKQRRRAPAAPPHLCPHCGKEVGKA